MSPHIYLNCFLIFSFICIHFVFYSKSCRLGLTPKSVCVQIGCIKFTREIESARLRDGNSLPEKFSIGVIDVTRALERMPPIARVRSSPQQPHSICSNHKAPLDQLQVVLLASDRWLMKHLPIMASSRRVPLIHVKDKKGGSLRLGELFRLRTAMAIGVKAKGNASNQLFEKILHGDEINHGTNCIDTIAMPDGPCQ
ncbi:uncharacterized protein LOC122315931 isoform X6 [Carya illinoinensis]|uniref:uncharacterized protein LOC122315931 isoform X6 n=1 Tax=Carya illinoinensis TaxID=32201 RepID=UPI001C717DF4|nr:uncharacterized protein LOC122315931 isoform X6 [Carya illinoinensis]